MNHIMTMKIERMIWIISFGIIGPVVSTILAAELSWVVVYGQNVTGNSSSTNVTQAGVDSDDSSRVIDLLIEHAGGGFTSLQTDADNQTWIATGTWDLVSDPANAVQSNSSAAQFNATIDTRQTDNSQGHEHKISEFNLVNSTIGSGSEGTNISFNGTATVETDVGLYSEVPISIRIIDGAPAIVAIDTQTNEIKPQWVPSGGTISLLIDERVQDHFGNTPIYGDIKEEKE
jgi:hypothetical protein